MGFYNIVLEGQQAEEYKARKAKEAKNAKHNEQYYRNKRYDEDNVYATERLYGINRYDQTKNVSGRTIPFDKLGGFPKSDEEYEKRYASYGRDLERQKNADVVAKRTKKMVVQKIIIIGMI